MSETDILWLIPLAPLLACLTIAALGPRLLRGQSHWPCVIGIAISCAVSMVVLFAGTTEKIVSGYDWISVGGLNVHVNLQADSLTKVMLATVTFVSLLVAIYSIGYMHGDPGYPRFFAEISLFVFSMTMLVLASNFLVLYVFWEGVGLCSYLLIGYWFQKPSASAAARKAFLVTRIGDVGFALGVFLIWVTFGTLDYQSSVQVVHNRPPELIPGVFPQVAAKAAASPGTILVICLLLFMGAVGKSAQFPLHVWLPDAMEGPSPVSALIHAATMVTAGVYMVARCTPLFLHAPEAQWVVAGIGGFTALLAALIALTQTDLKRVLAYSTISQLGYMFLALGSAGTNPKLATVAVIAAIFHLFTHAFFKALLFLSAGSVMHAMGSVIDMRRFGGLRRVLKHTHWTFLCGALALAGIPPLAGFWSKDEIVASVFHAIRGELVTEKLLYMVLFTISLMATFLTAFYTFRAYFLTFWGDERYPPEAGDHPHESPPVMLYPLFVLAAGAVLAGLLFGPTHLLADFLKEGTPGLDPRAVESFTATSLLLMGVSSLFAVAGVGLAAWVYLKAPDLSTRMMTALRGGYELSVNKFYLDEIYNLMIVQPLRVFAIGCRLVDQYFIDGLVDLVGVTPAKVGQLFRSVQNGLVQFYALAMVLGVVVFVVFLIWALAG